jgi:hypothetical protein
MIITSLERAGRPFYELIRWGFLALPSDPHSRRVNAVRKGDSMSKEQMRPASEAKAPDPSNSYERSHPENEAGMGRMKAQKTVPAKRADSLEASVTHKQDTTRQLNSEDVVDQRSEAKGST